MPKKQMPSTGRRLLHSREQLPVFGLKLFEGVSAGLSSLGIEVQRDDARSVSRHKADIGYRLPCPPLSNLVLVCGGVLVSVRRCRLFAHWPARENLKALFRVP
jgi:hypothetical protein